MEPESLLENADWARRLARRLVKDEHLADDLVQDAWLKAIEARSSRPSSLRAWLHRVLVNLSLRSARSDRRRSRREHRAARDEAVPSTDSIVDTLETHRLLAETVANLREPYRATLILRYYEDLTPGEIARCEGVAVTTVRSRIERGVACLREALDCAHAGDRTRWLGGLVPLYVERASSLRAPSMTKGVLMGSLATIVLVLFLMPDRSEPTDRGVVVDDRGQVTLDDLPCRPLVGFVSPRDRVARQFAVTTEHWKTGTAVVHLRRGGVVSGTIRRPDGSPAVIAVRLLKVCRRRPDPGREIGAHTSFGPGWLFGDAACRVLTDAKGRFQFSDVGDGDYRLSVDQAFDISSGPKAVRSGMTNVQIVVRTPGG